MWRNFNQNLTLWMTSQVLLYFDEWNNECFERLNNVIKKPLRTLQRRHDRLIRSTASHKNRSALLSWMERKGSSLRNHPFKISCQHAKQSNGVWVENRMWFSCEHQNGKTLLVTTKKSWRLVGQIIDFVTCHFVAGIIMKEDLLKETTEYNNDCLSLIQLIACRLLHQSARFTRI